MGWELLDFLNKNSKYNPLYVKIIFFILGGITLKESTILIIAHLLENDQLNESIIYQIGSLIVIISIGIFAYFFCNYLYKKYNNES